MSVIVVDFEERNDSGEVDVRIEVLSEDLLTSVADVAAMTNFAEEKFAAFDKAKSFIVAGRNTFQPDKTVLYFKIPASGLPSDYMGRVRKIYS